MNFTIWLIKGLVGLIGFVTLKLTYFLDNRVTDGSEVVVESNLPLGWFLEIITFIA